MLAPAIVLLALAADAPAPVTPPAGAARGFGPDDLLALPRVESPALSPDGARVAFTVARAAPGGERLTSALFLVPAAGGEPRQLTRGDERVSSPRFSPDGKRIAFLSDRGGPPRSTQAWVLDLAGGEAIRATTLPGGADAVLWTADGRSLLVTSDVDPRCGADAACNERAEAAARDRPRIATRLLFRHWTSWRERVRTHVLRVPLDGGPAVDLTPGDRDVPPFGRGGDGDLAVSPDGTTLYFVAVTDPVEAISTNADVYAVPIAGGEARRITTGPGWDGSPRPSPDGRRLAWLSQPRAGFESDRFHLMVAAADGSGARDLTAGEDLSAQEPWWARNGRALRFTADVAGSTAVYEVDVASGKLVRLTDPPYAGQIASLSPSRDGGVVAAIVHSMTDPPESAVLRPGKGRALEVARITSFATAALSSVPRPEVRPLAATSPDGTKVAGWLVLPPGRRPGERLPAVVLVHGGPQGAWDHAWTWRWNVMAFAAQGWAVVLPNPRGSTGYGQAYVDAISRDWGAEYDDVMAVLDAAIAAGDVDGARTCAAGGSYGGFMVNYVNGRTDRFRCLVVHAGLYDLGMMWGTTDELWFPEYDVGAGGPPWERPEAWSRFSPDRLVARWKTPTLVSHGELDYRCTVDQAYAAFTALQRRGIESKLLVFPDEGHWIQRPKNSKVFYDVVFGWLAEHLGTAAGASARAP
ncbi:MAG TPA: S9 family peptidase [Anaeromyxobacter sp.]